MDFLNISENCLNKMQHRVVAVKREPDIITAAFDGFDIGIYYSSFEYEVGFNFFCCNKKVHIGLDFALLAAGCPQDRLPKFLNMSDEQIMEEYITAYLRLVDEFYDYLSDADAMRRELKKL